MTLPEKFFREVASYEAGRACYEDIHGGVVILSIGPSLVKYE
jgi:hypothetical protein